MFTQHLRDVGKGLLCTSYGCSRTDFTAYLNLIRYFEYSTLADSINANTKGDCGMFKCDRDVLVHLFEIYC